MFHAPPELVNGLSVRQKRIYDFLNGMHCGVICSISPDILPHASVVYHVVNETDFSVSFLTKTGTRKYDDLIHDNHVVFIVFDEESQTVAQVTGNAYEITGPNDVNGIAARVYTNSLSSKKNGVLPIARLQAGTYTAFTIVPDQIRITSYGQPRSGDYEHMFDSIESFDLHPDRSS